MNTIARDIPVYVPRFSKITRLWRWMRLAMYRQIQAKDPRFYDSAL
jgi:hypothetical protein